MPIQPIHHREGLASADRAAARRAEGDMFRECPLCAERMRLHARETVTRVPGTSQEIRTVVREWICGECDYFEEVDDFGAAAKD